MLLKSFILSLLVCVVSVYGSIDEPVSYYASSFSIKGNTVTIQNVHRNDSYLKFSINDLNVKSTNKNDTHLNTLPAFSVEQKKHSDSLDEYTLSWDMNPAHHREICFHYGFNNASWFSTYEEIDQYFPMNTKKVQARAPFLTTDYFQGPFGSVLETLFLTSDGFSVHFNEDFPASIRRDPNNGDPLLCWTSENDLSKSYPLKVDIIMGKNIREVYDIVTRTNKTKSTIPKPSDIPSERMFKDPVWSTWVEYKSGVTQNKVLEFARAIKSNGFPASQIEIDDKWEKHYGDLKFDHSKFPDAKVMVKSIARLGFPVTLWIHPFVNENSAEYSKNFRYFVQNSNRTAPQKVSWWDGKGATIDFTDPAAADWFLRRLNDLKQATDIRSFKFDAGERNYYGSHPSFHDFKAKSYNNWITHHYVATVAKAGKDIEVRSSYRNQDQPIFTRLIDRSAGWGEHNGLRSIITGALTFSLAGYSFILPDMIGGNGARPKAELYIRWVQATALLPSMQFSITPWKYNESNVNVVEVTKKFVQLHQTYAPTIIKLAKERVATGSPIIRPMWWLEPNDERAFHIGDQFMLGDDIVVAPITHEGKTSRQVYLPSGKWTDHRMQVISGPGFHETKAELSELPLFIRANGGSTASTSAKTTTKPKAI